MKLEKITSMFKKKKVLNLWNKIYDDDGETKTAMQYLTDGYAAYPLENLPVFDKVTIMGLLGLPSDDDLNIFNDISPIWLETAFADYDDSDVPLTETAEMFGYAVFETFHNNENDNFPELCFFADPKYLAPIRDEDYEFLSREVIITKSPVRVIIVKAGLITKAVIVPHIFNEFELGKHLETAEKVYCLLRNLRDEYIKKDDDIELQEAHL